MARGKVGVAKLARLAAAEVGRAEDALADERRPLAGRIHTLRTALKKARALVRLCEAAGKKRARRAARRLRAVARAAAAARDAEVAVTTFDELVDASAAAAASPSVAETRERLGRRARALERAFRKKSVRRALGAALRRARLTLDIGKRRAPAGAALDAFDILVVGYRRARRALGVARAGGDDDAFHAWRRRVKMHRHQLAALEPLPPSELEARLEALDHLGLLLGQEHDLAALDRIVAAAPQLSDADRRRLRGILGTRRARLRARALALGARAFAETPRDLAGRLGRRRLR